TNTTDNAQLRIPRTHTSPAIIQLLKNLSLPNILQRNKKIEAENDARSAKTLNNALDPTVYRPSSTRIRSCLPDYYRSRRFCPIKTSFLCFCSQLHLQ
ncbi:hypothetical protein K443DRAFT_660384, partial [Laccaria amethystina LaAM-08-1]